MARSCFIFNEPNISAIYFCTIEFIQSTLHVRVGAKLNYSFVCAFFVSIRIGYFTCLSHEILKKPSKTGQFQKLKEKDLYTVPDFQE